MPAGIAAGKTFGLATLYMFPHYLWVRNVQLEGSNAYAAIDYGVTVALGRLVLGFSYSHLLERGARTTPGVQAGFSF